ncbi:hypothetical protein N7G274_009168 [Stereocaulon virgatum]|uniref:Basic proline-rich protein n=1 Tax=Stereocaulon virgatum TaxID=373712 RepID=A0ABR3ZZI4_9LECA
MVPRVTEPPIIMNPPKVDLDRATIKPLPALPSEMTFPRPITPRRATAPDPSPTLSPFSSLATTLPLRPRTRSPYARGHSRSRSSSGALSAPQMTRAHSSPVPNATDRFMARPSSPLGPPLRHRSPMRKPTDETFSSFGNQLDIDQTISENSELDLTQGATGDYDSTPASPTPYIHQTFPRTRRRPASPLSQSAFGSSTPKNTLRACTSTPSLSPNHYNESYPSNYSYSSGSIPSTPTSLRSRSPSISSLETIPDSPDAELEAEEIARLKAAADREEQSEEGVRRRLGGDSPGLRGRDKRKRWSVCGAERRGDLGLETIWEG